MKNKLLTWLWGSTWSDHCPAPSLTWHHWPSLNAFEEQSAFHSGFSHTPFTLPGMIFPYLTPLSISLYRLRSSPFFDLSSNVTFSRKTFLTPWTKWGFIGPCYFLSMNDSNCNYAFTCVIWLIPIISTVAYMKIDLWPLFPQDLVHGRFHRYLLSEWTNK